MKKKTGTTALLSIYSLALSHILKVIVSESNCTTACFSCM